MTIRILGIITLALLAGVLSAQASANLNATVNDDEEDLYLFNVDFGAMQTATIEVNIAATSGSSGISVNLVDLDELASNGTANAIATGANASATPVVVSLSPTYAGVHQFAVQVITDSLNGPSPYTGTISASTLAAGGVTLAGATTLPAAAGYYDLLGRGAREVIQNAASGTFSRDTPVDFGSTPQAITFWVQGIAFVSDATVEVFEVTTGGTESLLGTLTLNATNNLEDEANLTTSMRSGTVILRVKVTASAAGLHIWQMTLPDQTTSNPTPGGGGGTGSGGGGGGGGCSTSGAPGRLMLIGLLAALGVATRIATSRPRP